MARLISQLTAAGALDGANDLLWIEQNGQPYKITPNALIAGGGGGGQTPWASDIDGAGFGLDNIDRLEIQAPGIPGDTATFTHDGTDFDTTFVNTTDWNISGITSIQAGTVTADFDAITGTSYGGILEANLLDKTADETVSGAYTFSDDVTLTGFTPTLRLGDAAGTNDAELILYGHQGSTTYGSRLRADSNALYWGPYTTEGSSSALTMNATIGTWTFGKGATVRYGDSTDTDYTTMKNFIDRFELNVGGSNRLAISTTVGTQYSGGGYIWLRDGGELRIQDAGDTDYAAFSHDGTDFNTAFTNTVNWALTGLTGNLQLDNDEIQFTTNNSGQKISGRTGSYIELYNGSTGDIVLNSANNNGVTVNGPLAMGGYGITNIGGSLAIGSNTVSGTSGAYYQPYNGTDGDTYIRGSTLASTLLGDIKFQTGETPTVQLEIRKADGNVYVTNDLDADNLTATTINGVALTTAGTATSYLNETGGYSVPPGNGSTASPVTIESVPAYYTYELGVNYDNGYAYLTADDRPAGELGFVLDVGGYMAIAGDCTLVDIQVPVISDSIDNSIQFVADENIYVPNVGLLGEFGFVGEGNFSNTNWVQGGDMYWGIDQSGVRKYPLYVDNSDSAVWIQSLDFKIGSGGTESVRPSSYVTFDHDATDLNIAGTSTTDINLTGITDLNLSGITGSINLGNATLAEETNTIELVAGAGYDLDLKAARGVRIYLDTNNDETSSVFEVLSNTLAYGAGSVVASINQSGDLTANTVNGVALTTGGAATNYLDETGNYSVPAGAGGGTFDGLTSKALGTGDYKTTGHFVSGVGSGGVALTINDGQGNANVTFNHENGIAEQAGNAGRIIVNTDSTTGASMSVELLSNASSGAIETLPQLIITESDVSFESNSISGVTTIGASGVITASGGTSTNWNTAFGWGDHDGLYADIGGLDTQNFKINILQLTNREDTDLSLVGQIAYDTNDSNTTTRLGSFNSTDPIGLYVHDGVDTRSIWTTDNFGSTQVANWQTAFGWGDHAGLYGDAVLADNETVTGDWNFEGAGTHWIGNGTDAIPIFKHKSGASIGGWARGSVFANAAGVSQAGIGALGAADSLTNLAAGFGTTWYTSGSNNGWAMVSGAMTVDANVTLTSGHTVTASGSTSANWNTAFGWGDHDGLYEPILTNTLTLESAAGDATLFLKADTDNGVGNEDSNPFIRMEQDGNLVYTVIGMAGNTNVDAQGNTYTGYSVTNGFVIHHNYISGGISLGVNNAEAFFIDSDNDVFINETLSVTGAVTAASYDGVNLTTAGSANNFLNEAGAYTDVSVSALANGTDGELITWSATGVATTVATGTSGHVLTSNGAGAAPTFQAAAGGGAQTPWTSDIDGGGFGLDNIDRLEIQAPGVATDTATFTHDGTDFNTSFANTTDWNITGITALKTTTLTGTGVASGLVNGLNLVSTAPSIWFSETDAVTNERGWKLYASGGQLRFRTTDNSGVSAGDVFEVNRTGTVVDDIGLFANNALEAWTQDHNASGNTSGFATNDYGGTKRDVGFATMEEVTFTVNTTVTADHWSQKALVHTSATSHNLTFNTLTTVPNGAVMWVKGRTGSVVLVDGTMTLNWYNGTATIATGNRTLAKGGWATITKTGDSSADVTGIGII
jgi:hypothetical protein